MRVIPKLINGLVFGISHQYYLDFDAVEEETESFAEKLKEAPRAPMIFIYIGPLQLIITW